MPLSSSSPYAILMCMFVDFAHGCHGALCTGWLQPEASNGGGKPTLKSMSEHLKDTHRSLKMVKYKPQKGMDINIWTVSLMLRLTIWLCNALHCVWLLSVQQVALSWEPVETIGSRWNLAGGNRKRLLKVKPAWSDPYCLCGVQSPSSFYPMPYSLKSLWNPKLKHLLPGILS